MDAWEFDDFEDVIFLVYVLFYNELEKKYGDSEDFASEYPNIFSEINSDTSKGGIFNKILQAVSNKEIESNYTGAEDIFHIQIAALPFYDWVKKEGYEISYMAEKSVKWTVSRRGLRVRVATFKEDKLAVAEFHKLVKEPLWELNAAILYISGYTSYGYMEVDRACVDSDAILKKAHYYAIDGRKIKALTLIDSRIPYEKQYSNAYDRDSQVEVRPHDFIQWAKNIPLEFSMLGNLINTATEEIAKPAYITPEMNLMFDAAEYFWKDYDLKNPDTGKAPYKKDVITWLQSEAKIRGIYKLSDNIANAMDTIIRCPESRKGGSTS